MPRINATSIEEHVRVQTARILDAAGQLFREKGYRCTDMDDIASAVGLARNSLYRYYGNKDFILLACVARDMEAYLAEMKSMGDLYTDTADRIGAWLDLQIDFATSPAHATLEFMAEIRSDAPRLQQQVMKLHDAPATVLNTAVAESLRGKRRDAGLVAALVRGLVEVAAGQAQLRVDKSLVKRELHRAVTCLLGN
ncbi:MAG: helix-turn-helix domain-containing protein [Gammaproteobacteria bacterium]